ncbi:hypothetical protein [Tenacibaculum geojense]|uniref:Uncharacterized protein n=1 Tax=Tenacibaculum geojense TaxID=915352 RepID=A0ABW3JR47_9FLAO
MIDKLFLKYLTKKGKIGYFVGQIITASLWAYYIFGVEKLSRANGEVKLFAGLLINTVLWGVISVMLWKKQNITSL